MISRKGLVRKDTGWLSTVNILLSGDLRDMAHRGLVGNELEQPWDLKINDELLGSISCGLG